MQVGRRSQSWLANVKFREQFRSPVNDLDNHLGLTSIELETSTGLAFLSGRLEGPEGQLSVPAMSCQTLPEGVTRFQAMSS